MIKGAPYSFAFVCVVAVSACIGGFQWFYHEKFVDSEQRANRWKSDAEYWKDQASHPTQALPSTTIPPVEGKSLPPKIITRTLMPQFEIHFTEKPFRRNDSKLPYGLEVTIEPDREIEPVGLLVVCDGEIGYYSGWLKSGGNFSQVSQNLLGNHHDVFVMKWKAPAWKPGDPLIVQLFSETLIHVKSVDRVHYYWP